MEKDCQELLREIRLLNEEYSKVVEGRKEIIRKIRNKINEIRKITSVYNMELDELERYYSYRDYYISDYKVAMNLLLRLVNANDELYAMKEINTTDYYDTSTGKQRLTSKILFITDKGFSEKFNGDLYFHNEFQEKATYGINNGHSMIVITANLFEPNVKPKKELVNCDNVVTIRNSGLIGNITCYVNGLTLKEGVDKFVNYIDENGPDFKGIDEDTLFEVMNKSNKSQKSLLKNCIK